MVCAVIPRRLERLKRYPEELILPASTGALFQPHDQVVVVKVFAEV
jgi:hypothetical protein